MSEHVGKQIADGIRELAKAAGQYHLEGGRGSSHKGAKRIIGVTSSGKLIPHPSEAHYRVQLPDNGTTKPATEHAQKYFPGWTSRDHDEAESLHGEHRKKLMDDWDNMRRTDATPNASLKEKNSALFDSLHGISKRIEEHESARRLHGQMGASAKFAEMARDYEADAESSVRQYGHKKARELGWEV